MNLIIQCGGGLCNRINNIINGIYLSELLNRKLYVWWELDNACHCPLEKLFSNGFDQDHKEIYTDEFVYYSPFHTDRRKAKIKNTHGELKFRLTWRYENYQSMHNRPDEYLSDRSSSIITELKSIKSPNLIFSSSLILTEIIPENVVRKILSSLVPVPELDSHIQALIETYNINSSVIGIHLRRTDYNLLNDDDVINSINNYLKSNSKTRFLICSDSFNSEQKFKNLYPDNVIIIPYKYYTEKINSNKSDSEFSNLMRTEESVKNALADMYLLAHTSFEIFSPISTFAQTAFRISKTF